MLEWRRRPLFYAALFLSSAIAVFPHPVKSQLGPEGPALLGGKIVSEVESRESFPGYRKDHFILDVEKRWEGLDSPADNVRGRVRVSWKNLPAGRQARPEYGDMLVLEGELVSFPGRRNPGGFDAKAYWHHRRVQAAFFAKKDALHKILARGRGNPVRVAAIGLKRFLSERLSRDFDGNQSAFLKALFLGERSDLDEDFKDLFLKTGTMHILAVSGFNIGFLYAVLWLFLKPVPMMRNIKLAVILAVIWTYCLVVGWQAPVVRATIMATVFILGDMLGRKGDGLNALGLAACLILLLNPLELFDIGFQLSFLAVFGLITLSPVFFRREGNKFFIYAEELFWTSFICYFLTLPVIVQNFYILTPYALLANLAVVPLSFLLFFFALPYFLFPFFAGAMKAVITLLVKSLFLIENLPGAVWITGKLAWPLAGLLGVGIVFFLFFKIKTRRLRVLGVVLCCVLIFSAQEAWRFATRRFEATVLDVGQGDALYLQFAKGGGLLVDAGDGRFSDKGRWVVAPFLRHKGVRSLDIAISHPQQDHIGGFSTVLKDFRVKRVFHAGVPYDSGRWRALQKEIEKEQASVQTVRRGEEIRGYEGTRILVLHPEPGEVFEKNINDASLVLKVVHEGGSLLLTGDIQEKAMRSLMGSGLDLRADALKVPHHGGKAGPAGASFFAAVSPRLSVVSSGARNPFGHPAAETLSALEAVPGNKILRTDRSGAVRLVSEGGRMFLDG